jgi:hypothetical protein
MACVVILLDVQRIVLELDDRALVVVDVSVVRCRENCDYCWEFGGTVPFVELVAIELGLVGSDDTKQLVALEEGVHGVDIEEK